MLQRKYKDSIVDDSQPDSSEHSGTVQLVDLGLGLLLRRYVTILFFTLLGLAAGVTYVLVAPPTYTAEAKVMIGVQKPPVVQQQSMFTDFADGPGGLETQIQILQSKAIMSSVVENLQLANDPEFSSPAIGLFRRVFNYFVDRTLAKPKLDPTEVAVAAVSDRLTVRRVGASLVIEIGFSSRSPEKSAQIANAVANAYLTNRADAKREANRTASDWLQERLLQLGEQNAAAERAVIAFQQENNIVAAAGRRMDEQSLAELNTRLVAARTHTSDLLARLERIESIIQNWNSNTSLDGAISDANPILTNLRQQYLDLARKEAEYSARFGRNHQAVVNLRNRLQDLRTSTFEELRRMAEAFKSDYEIAKHRQAEIDKQLVQIISQSQTMNNAQVNLRELESTAKTYNGLYESFLQRFMAGIQQDTYPVSDAQLISLASPPTRNKPRPELVLALSLFGGIALGAGFGLLRDATDRVFRTSAQLQSLLQMPCVALVPLLKGAAAATQSSRKQVSSKAFDQNQRMIVRNSGVFWRVVDTPLSRFAESIRSIKLAVQLNLTSKPSKVIGITSSLPNEGKSTIAAALAQLVAQANSRVIVIDCDLRNPSLSRCLAPEATIGFADVISGAQSLEEVVWRDSTTNLVFLPAVQNAPPSDTSEVLGAEKTRMLFDKLRADFDTIIIDLPPLAPVIDVRAAAHLVDHLILVVEWGRTKIDVVQEALSTAPNLWDGIIGAVLNKTDMNKIYRYDLRRRNLYKNKYYARYGYSNDD